MMRCKGMCTEMLDKLACVDGDRAVRGGRRSWVLGRGSLVVP